MKGPKAYRASAEKAIGEGVLALFPSYYPRLFFKFLFGPGSLVLELLDQFHPLFLQRSRVKVGQQEGDGLQGLVEGPQRGRP